MLVINKIIEIWECVGFSDFVGYFSRQKKELGPSLSPLGVLNKLMRPLTCVCFSYSAKLNTTFPGPSTSLFLAVVLQNQLVNSC